MRRDYALLRRGALALLLPQPDVVAIDHLDPAAGLPPRAVALAFDLQPMPQVPSGCRIVTAFAGSPLAWCWEAVDILLGRELQVHPLPCALGGGARAALLGGIVEVVVDRRETVAFLTDAARLAQRVPAPLQETAA